MIDGTAFTPLSRLFEFQRNSEQVNVLAIIVVVDGGGSLRISDRSRAGITPIAVQGITLGTGDGKTNKEEVAADSTVNIAKWDCLLLRDFFVDYGKRLLPCLYAKSGAGTWHVRKAKGGCCVKCGRPFSEREEEEINDLCKWWDEGMKGDVCNIPLQ